MLDRSTGTMVRAGDGRWWTMVDDGFYGGKMVRTLILLLHGSGLAAARGSD